MTITKRGDTWLVSVYIGRVNGKRRQINRTVHGNKKAALKVERELQLEVAAGRHQRNITIEELLTRWINHAGPELSPTTLRTYQMYIDTRIIPALGDTQLEDLTTARLDQFYDDLRAQYAPASIRQIHAIIRRACRVAIRWGWITTNPAADAAPPTARPQRHDPPTPDAIGRVLLRAATVDPQLHLFVRLAVVTGARRGELCALRWEDIDLELGAVTISRSRVVIPGTTIDKTTKSGKARVNALDTETLTTVRSARAAAVERALALGWPLEHVFTTHKGTPWRPDHATQAWRRIADLEGVDARLHDLRHAAATQLLAAGVSVRQVADRLGHSNPTVTLNVYSHAIPAADQASADIIAGTIAKR